MELSKQERLKIIAKIAKLKCVVDQLGTETFPGSRVYHISDLEMDQKRNHLERVTRKSQIKFLMGLLSKHRRKYSKLYI